MISEATPCFQHNPQGFHMYGGGMEGMIATSVLTSGDTGISVVAGADAHCNSLLYSLSILREKVQQAESIVSVVVSPSQIQQGSVPMAVAVAGAGTVIQEIIAAASTMMYAFQQLAVDAAMAPDELSQHHVKVSNEGSSHPSSDNHVTHDDASRGGYFHSEAQEGYSANIPTSSAGNAEGTHAKVEMLSQEMGTNPAVELGDFSAEACEVIELGAADLLAKYTHYCQVCGKGFKRDANLRMHMRAHGDEYKTNAALSNPLKHARKTLGFDGCSSVMGSGRKYSCPQEGCRWNRRHPRFQPLKSMVCAKNHYKRSHCPKMYVCNRCNRKQFSVLSDLRTHEKHCGDLRWQCSCGTTFSRKDKLMGHVALFAGHAPAVDCFPKQGRAAASSVHRPSQIRIDG